MGRKGGIWALFVVGYLEVGLCVEPPRGARSASQISGGRDGFQQEQPTPNVVWATRPAERTTAWVGPFELLSEEDIFGTKRKGPSAPPVPDNGNDLSLATNTTETAPATGDGPTGPRRRLQKWNNDVSTAVIDRVSRRVGEARDGGARAVQTLAARSLVLGREGGVWLRRRWRRKAAYCLVGFYGLRLTWRVISRIKTNVLSSGDILLDAEDRILASRGAVLDTEGQAILLRLNALGSPTTTAAGGGDPAATDIGATASQPDVPATATHEITQANENSTCSGCVAAATAPSDAGGEETGGRDGGWEAVEASLRDAISLRCVARGGADAGGRARYTEELSEALRNLEQARDEADMESFGPQHDSLVEQGVLLTQARLCDACLRSLRDGLIRASSDLSGLADFWKDQRSTHRRMGVVKSVVLGRLVHGQVSAKRLAVEKDQESISTAELLLEGYLERLGGVQTHLQARPKSCLVNPGFSATTAAGGATFTRGTVEALECWVDEGMHIFIGSLEHVEAAFDQQQTTEDENSSSIEEPQDVGTSGGIGSDEHSPSLSPKEDEAVPNEDPAEPATTAARDAAATTTAAAVAAGRKVLFTDAVENFVSSVVSIVANTDRVPSSVLQLRAGGGCVGGVGVEGGVGGDGARGCLPSGAAGTKAAAAAAYGKNRSGLPAVILLPPKRKKARQASGGGKQRGSKSATEESPRKSVASPAKETPGPVAGSRRGEGGGGIRWGKSAAAVKDTKEKKKETAKGSKKEASVGGKRNRSDADGVSRGLWGRLTGEDRRATKKNVRVEDDGGGGAAKWAAGAGKDRQDAKGNARKAAVDSAKKKAPSANDSKKKIASVKTGSVPSKDGRRDNETENRKVAPVDGASALERWLARFAGGGKGTKSPERKKDTSRSNGDRKPLDSKKTEQKKGSNSSAASAKKAGPTSTSMGATTTASVTSWRAGTREVSSTRQGKKKKKNGARRAEGTAARDGFGSRGGAGDRQENRLDKLGKDYAEEGFKGDRSSPLPPVAAAAAAAALRRPVEGGEKSAPSVPKTEAKGGGAFLSGPSAAAAAGGDGVPPAGFSSPSSLLTGTLTPGVYARARQREEDYARGRRTNLTGRKHDGGASVLPAPEKKAESADSDSSDVSSSGVDSGVEPPRLGSIDDDVAPTGENVTETVGALSACARYCTATCGSIAGSVSRGTVAVVTSPAKLVRLVAGGVAPSTGTDLEAGDKSAAAVGGGGHWVVEDKPSGSDRAAAGGVPASSEESSPHDDDDAAAFASAVDNDDGSSRTGVLAFCKDCCTAACVSIFGGISSGAMEVVNSETVLVGTVPGSLVLSEGDPDEDDGEQQSSFRAAAEGESEGRAFDSKGHDGADAGGSSAGRDEKVDTLLTLSYGDGEACRSAAGGVAPGFEKTVGTVHAAAGTAFGSMDLDDERVAAAAEGAVATSAAGAEKEDEKAAAAAAATGRTNVSGLVTRPLQAFVVRPCAHLAAAGAPALSAPGNLARGIARSCGRASRSAGRASGDVSRAVGAGCGRAGRSTAAAATAAWLFTAATAYMLGDAVAQGAVKSTKACLGCVELAGRVLVVLPANTAARIVGRVLPGVGGAAAKDETVGAAAPTPQPPTEAAAVDRATTKKRSSSSRAPASISRAGRLQRWTSRAASYPGRFLPGRRSSGRRTKVTADLPSPLSSVGGDVANVVLTSPAPPSTAREAQAALARWSTSAPSEGVPEGSGRRSRLLVGSAARAGRIVVPSCVYTSTGSKSTVKAVGAPGGTRALKAPRITRALRVLAAQQAAEAGAARPAHWRRVRRVLRLAVAVPVAVQSARYAQSNRTKLGRVATEAATGVSSFFSDQLWQPCEAIRKQVFFQERAKLMDKDSLEDAETSLQNMLRDFVNDKQNEVPEELREEAAETMDMSVVSRKLEKETKSSVRGTVNGRIPRMLLIQATFLKKELLHLMEAIDELFRANQVTLKLISVVPAALLIFAAIKVSTPFVHVASSRRWEPTALVHRSMRGSLREVERLLTSSRGFVGSRDLGDGPAVVAGLGLLEDQEMGKMALHLHKLQTTLRLNGTRFDSRTRRKVEEDLADLMARGRPTVSQQVAVVHRMQHSYAFLRSEGGGGGRRK